VQRNINQQNCLEQGVQNGSPSNKEVSTLETGQAQRGQTEAQSRSGRPRQRQGATRIQNKGNRQSLKVFREKQNNR
jgi:hypothetical protein